MLWQSVRDVPVGLDELAGEIVTIALPFTEPPLFVATKLYDVVAEGFTVVGLVAATPFKVTVGLVPVTVQLRTEFPPAAIVAGDAAKLVITGTVPAGAAAAAFTVTVILLLTVPPAPTAVRV